MATRTLFARALFVSFGILFPVSASAQVPGEVLWHQKVSAAKGGGPRGIKTDDQFGRAAAAIGDLDGDGIGDFAVGALGDDDNTPGVVLDYGACWILFMNRNGTVRSHYKISRSSAGLPLDPADEWGRTVRELGDWDLDGIPDLMVGTCYDDDNGTDKGAFYMLMLNRNGSVKSWKKISETSGGFTGDLDPDDQFGRGIRVLGDLDLDGVPEIGVGSIRDDDGGNNRGAYWILFMRRDCTVRSWKKLSETQGNFQSKLSDYGEFGFDACVLGDRNGDGIQDIAISSPDQNTDGAQQGAVFIVYMNRDGSAKSDFRIAENKGNFNGNMLDYNDEFGCAIDCLGDLDNDGYKDIVVGAGKDDDGPVSGSFDRGAMYVLFLKADANVKSWQKISRLSGRFYGNIDDGDRFGTSMACPGDLNGDGTEDVFVGVRFDDDGGSGAGCQYFLTLNDGHYVPPGGKFLYTPKLGRAPLAVQFTDQSTGTVTGWDWDFGDGTISSERDPLHTYVTSGVKTVRCVARGPAGSQERVYKNIIKVDPPLKPALSFQGAPLFGMAPLAVQFSDATTGLVASRAWDFGDGSTSTETSPNHVYAVPGRYTVSLTATNETGSNTLTRSDYVVITDVPPPVAAFSCDSQSGLAPLAVQFTDATTGEVTAWAWSFGDGATSNERNPQHTYLTAGAFTVTLTATGRGGSDVETKTGLVAVQLPAAPTAGFTTSATSGIDPLTVQFTDASSGAILTRAWSFGDGATSSETSPAHTYLAAGVYTVTLVVTGPGGSDDEQKLDLVTVITVPRGLADGSFEQQSAGGAPSGAWTITGGGEHVVEPLPDAPFPADGLQWLRLSSAGTSYAMRPVMPSGEALPFGGAGVEQRFYLQDPSSVLEFDAAFVRGGAANDPSDADWMSVDVSDGVTTQNLFFADDTSAAPETSALLGLPRTALRRVTADLRRLFPLSVRNTQFTLSIRVGNGGEDVTPSFALVDRFTLGTWVPPVAKFVYTPNRAKAPHEVRFTDQSTGHVTSWEWSFGDGATSTERNPRHTYLTAGLRTVTLKARGPGGQHTRTLTNIIRTDLPLLPTAAFQASPLFGMAPLEVRFDDTSTGLITGWTWDFGDGATSTEQEPAHVYTAAGRYTVALTTRNETGTRSTSRLEYVAVTDVAPPVADFTSDLTTGLAPFAVQFADATTGVVTAWSWSFGDGATSSQQSPQHTYLTGGTFTVTLTATGPGGSDLESKMGFVTAELPLAPTAGFTTDVTSGIDPLTVRFTDQSSGAILTRAWFFGDGATSSETNPTHVYATAGIYTVTLTVTGPGGTDDEQQLDLVTVISVPRGLADGSFEQQVGGGAPAGAWTVTGGAEHVVEPATGLSDAPFPRNGLQWLRLSSAGTSYATRPVVPSGEALPFGGAGVEQAFYLADPASVLEFDAAFVRGGVAGDPLDADWMSVDVTDGVTTQNLFFADGTTATPETSAILGLPRTATRRVTADLRRLFPLSVRNTQFTLTIRVGNGGEDVTPSFGMVDDFALGAWLPPVAKFAYTPNRAKAPHEVRFTDQSTGHVTSWEWSFGDGATSTERNPRHTYMTAGLRSVTLKARGPGGQHQRVLTNVIRTDPPALPTATFQASPLFGMAPLEVRFDDTSTGLVTGWSWDFGDGVTSTEQEPVHVYTAAGRYTVTLTARNEAGTRSTSRPEYVVVTDIAPPDADFTCDVPTGMAPHAVQFQDATTGEVTAWSWSFGDGATSNLQSPQHTYLASGTFTVMLTATGPGGANVETKAGLVTVLLPAPPDADFVANVTAGIDPLTVGFTDLTSGAVTSRAWSFGDGGHSIETNPTHTYLTAGVYTVTLVATGPGGSDDAQRIDLVTVISVPRGLADASFEEQTAGAPPSGAWRVIGGFDHVVEPALGIADGPFPGDGAQWLRLSSAGTSFARRPTISGGETIPSFGGGGVEQRFYLEEPLTVLELDAAFVRGDTLDDDWMSIDVTDGITTVNLFLADGSTPTPETSAVLGLPRSIPERVRADLRALFPGSGRNTRFTLTILLGNAGDDLAASYGLIDDLRLEQRPASALRYGCDPAVRGSLTVLSGEARAGATLTLGVTNPLGTQGPNSRAFVWMSTRADALFPCGTPLPNFGMAGPGAMGEILVNRNAGILLKTVQGGVWNNPSTPASVSLVMPATSAWIGLPLYVQGYLVDARVTYGVRTGVTDGLKLLIGP